MHHELKAILRDPVSGGRAVTLDEEELTFEDGTTYPVRAGAPIIFHPDSIFSSEQVLRGQATTQDRGYRDDRPRNRIRKALPPLSRPASPGSAGYRALAGRRANELGLVIGAGDRIDQYRRDFGALQGVICADVHAQFGCDAIFDAHWIPVADDTFSVLLAAEVLEHTFRPWQVATELERVAAPGALIQIEVPFVFPLHSAPYDFFRFTVFGLRSLFRASAIDDLRIAGGFSASAVALSDAVTNTASRRIPRIALNTSSRLALAALKFLDRSPTADWRSASLPRSIALTLRYDRRDRRDEELLEDVRTWLDEAPLRSWT